MRLPFGIEIREQDAATLINLLFGMLALLFLAENTTGNVGIAAALILVSVIADGADGYLARTRGQGRLGFELDSLADFASFGLVASILAYYAAREGIGNQGLFFIIFVVSFLYTGSSIIRLARYNVTPADDIFYGLPITAGGLFIALYILAGLPTAGLPIVVLILAGLMASDLEYPKVRNTGTLLVVGLLLVIALILFGVGVGYWIPSLILLVLSVVYILNPLYRRRFS
ncbi:MAG: CDP-alcohol phosphatidyltransferase family protein [Halobacteriota archaeon]